jgi:hypothetical protein
MRVILRAVFGLNEGPRYQRLERLLEAMLDRMSNPLSISLLYFPMLRQDFGPLSPWGNFVRVPVGILFRSDSVQICAEVELHRDVQVALRRKGGQQILRSSAHGHSNRSSKNSSPYSSM